MKTKPVMVRLSEAEFNELNRVAALKRSNKSEILRTFMHEGLAGFDRKHEALLNEIQAMREAVEVTRSLTASAVGALALMNVERHNAAAIQDIKKNLDESFGLAKATDQLLSQFVKKPTGGI